MIEQKLEQYLTENEIQFYEGTIKYNLLRNMKRLDGSTRRLHVVHFLVSISDQTYDGDAGYFATFDDEKHHLVEIVGPQYYKKIEE